MMENDKTELPPQARSVGIDELEFKPLVWQLHPNRIPCAIANSLIGQYRVGRHVPAYNGNKAWWMGPDNANFSGKRGVATYEDAKLAAYKDYKSRILAEILPNPTPAARVVAKSHPENGEPK